MQHHEFAIGKEFTCGDKRWRCADIGNRTIVAIALEHPGDTSWYNGPPYAVTECVFDEYDTPACAPVTDPQARPTQ
jgi:hypothetical protein